jgi:opacity protein-like surface antigen
MKKTMMAVAIAAACACAQAEGSNWRAFASIGLAGGGEEITEGDIVQQGTNSSHHFQIKAGDGLQFRVGADYRLLPRLTLQGSVGYSNNAPMGYNGSLTFSTMPVELLAFVDLTDSLRIGGGARKTRADMKATGVAENWPEVGIYDSSAGSVVELQYLSALSARNKTQFGVSLRCVTETFTHSRTGFRFNGNHYELAAALYY